MNGRMDYIKDQPVYETVIDVGRMIGTRTGKQKGERLGSG